MTNNTDKLLDEFRNLAEIGHDMPLTVISDGQLISGEVVAYSTYMSLLTEQVELVLPAASAYRPAADKFRKESTDAADRRKARHDRREELLKLEASPEEIEDSDLEKSDELNYLHLRSVTIGTGRETTALQLWRVRLDTITGWSLGRREI